MGLEAHITKALMIRRAREICKKSDKLNREADTHWERKREVKPWLSGTADRVRRSNRSENPDGCNVNLLLRIVLAPAPTPRGSTATCATKRLD